MGDFTLAFTDKNITPWGGLAVMKRLCDRINLGPQLERIGLPKPGSNRAYSPAQLIMQLLLSVWCGANRFEHCEVTRHDKTLAKIFGINKMAGHRAISRLFAKFDQYDCEAVFDNWYKWFFSGLKIGGVTLDLDSTIMTRYGLKEEGASKGYNPKKPGRNSHHPLMAFVADTHMIGNIWLRPGNCGTANNAIGFLENTLHRLSGKRCELLRADSGFSENMFLKHLENKGIPYTVALRLTYPLQRALVDIDQQWWPLYEAKGQGIELCCFTYQAQSWDKPRRVVAIRQSVKDRDQAKGKTLSLFPEDEEIGSWRYSAIVTDLNLPPVEVWRIYRGRANCENQIKELKYDFGATGFNQRNFWATEAALLSIMMGFNLMSLLRTILMKNSPTHTLKTLRYKLFGVAGYITVEGRKQFLKLAMAMKRRCWFEGLWHESHSFNLPVQFTPIFVHSETKLWL